MEIHLHMEEFHRKLIEKLQIDQKNSKFTKQNQNYQYAWKFQCISVDFNATLFDKLLPYRPICIEIAYQSVCTEISMQKSMNNCYHINRYALELHIVRYALKFQWNKALIIATTSTDVQNWLWLFVLGWSGGVFLSSWYKADTQPG